MNRLLVAAAILAASTAPSAATLQLAAQIGPDSFFCADNTACDTNPAVGTIQVNNDIIDGIRVDGSIQVSDHGEFPSINTSSLDLINTIATPVTVTVAVSDTGFAAIAATFTSAGSGTWQGPGGSAITMGWFVDPANAQGADNAFDTPGTLIDSFSNATSGRTSAFSHNGTTLMTLFAPFSMTEQSTISLAAGEALINRGQALVTSEVPEPATWVMFLIGAAFLGYTARSRVSRPTVDSLT